ncbi:MAG: NAD(P)/FAD-dependent oxidoreductase [Elusimicrobia bacterium]|nr:NAD(P)/FAD-dependent oxidoreductase [Elusimicrobiota bacterium]
MNRFDVVVVGCGRAGSAIADALAATGRRVAAVKLDHDDHADRVSLALDGLAPPQPSPIRFELLKGPAKFLSPKTLSVAGQEVEARRFVLAAGGRPRIEPGLTDLNVLSSLTALTSPPPASAVILGGGPVAAVIADRYSRAGGSVTILGRAMRFLPAEDESVADALAGRFRARGIEIHAGVVDIVTRAQDQGFSVSWPAGNDVRELKVESVVAATGLRANTDGLDLKSADVYVADDGHVVIDDELRTSNPCISAVGHITSPGCSLAMQDHHAELVAQNFQSPFYARQKLEITEPPRIVRTSPPIARVGASESEARRLFRDVVTAVAPYFDGANDASAAGVIKLVGRRRGGRLLGAHLVGAGAPELVLFFDLLVRSEIPLADVPERRHFPLPGPTDAAYRALTAWVNAAYG